MTINKIARGMLFCMGVACGAITGNLFHLGRIAPGAAMLALTATFLFFAMSNLGNNKKDENEEIIEALLDLRQALATLSVMLADDTLDGFKRIGRTMPGTPAEINKIEDELLPFLSSIGVSRNERERIIQEINKLKTRSRQGEGRRALTGVR